MKHLRSSRSLGAAFGVLGAGLAMAYSSTVSGAVPASHVEDTVAREYAAVGQPTSAVDCDPLDGEVGATTTCEATVSGAVQRVGVRADRVRGTEVRYEIRALR